MQGEVQPLRQHLGIFLGILQFGGILRDPDHGIALEQLERQAGNGGRPFRVAEGIFDIGRFAVVQHLPDQFERPRRHGGIRQIGDFAKRPVGWNEARETAQFVFQNPPLVIGHKITAWNFFDHHRLAVRAPPRQQNAAQRRNQQPKRRQKHQQSLDRIGGNPVPHRKLTYRTNAVFEYDLLDVFLGQAAYRLGDDRHQQRIRTVGNADGELRQIARHDVGCQAVAAVAAKRRLGHGGIEIGGILIAVFDCGDHLIDGMIRHHRNFGCVFLPEIGDHVSSGKNRDRTGRPGKCLAGEPRNRSGEIRRSQIKAHLFRPGVIVPAIQQQFAIALAERHGIFLPIPRLQHPEIESGTLRQQRQNIPHDAA
ncbi:hypothetical protein SDC9_113934 [bioreactor metagenome]|uniref:Uncharacterized protein n=1 Tax=bioreactor metagenome TaxID=1076179 RepID=A0A645BNI0_9ZZZZ